MREWQKRGKSTKYDKLTEEFDKKYKIAAEKYMRKKIDALKEVNPGKAYGILKNMGAQPGDATDDHTFTLPSHQKENLTEKQCAEKIADFFAAISNEYSPLKIETLPHRVKKVLDTESTPPIIS